MQVILNFWNVVMRSAYPVIAFLFAAVVSSAANADETPFASVYTTDVLPSGAKEIEQWLTWENSRPFETYNRLEGRTEFEYGFTDNFQGSLYLNYDWIKNTPNTPAADTGFKDDTHFTGVSGELIYRLADPYTHPVGLALYVEPLIGADNREIEFKALVQKNFLDDRLVLAGNGVLEYEWRKANGEWGHNTEVKLLLGLSYRVAPNWFAGAEFQFKREFDGHIFSGESGAAADSFFLGPVLHYTHQNWWLTAAAQAQLPTAGNLNGQLNETVDGYAHEEPRLSLRLRFGIEI
jgi:hypothetical protein